MTFTYTDASGAVHYLDARVSYAHNPVPLTLVTCSHCGGQGGEPGSNFGDTGWHPCYRCGTTGQEAFYVDLSKAEPITREDDVPAVMASVSGPWRKYYPNAFPARVELRAGMCTLDHSVHDLPCLSATPLIARGEWTCCQGCANDDGCYRDAPAEPPWL